MKEFFKLNDWYKILSFVILSFFFIKRYFDLGFNNSEILFIKIGYPIFVIIGAYIMSCALGIFIKSILKPKKIRSKMDVWSIIFTKLHFYILLLVVILVAVFLFGKTFGDWLTLILPLVIALIVFIYWLYSRNR